MLFLHFCHSSDHMHLPFKFGASNRPLNWGCTYQLLIPQVLQLKIGEFKVEISTFPVGGLVYVSGIHKCFNTYYYYYHKKYNDPPPTLILPKTITHPTSYIMQTHTSILRYKFSITQIPKTRKINHVKKIHVKKFPLNDHEVF